MASNGTRYIGHMGRCKFLRVPILINAKYVGLYNPLTELITSKEETSLDFLIGLKKQEIFNSSTQKCVELLDLYKWIS